MGLWREEQMKPLKIQHSKSPAHIWWMGQNTKDCLGVIENRKPGMSRGGCQLAWQALPSYDFHVDKSVLDKGPMSISAVLSVAVFHYFFFFFERQGPLLATLRFAFRVLGRFPRSSWEVTRAELQLVLFPVCVESVGSGRSSRLGTTRGTLFPVCPSLCSDMQLRLVGASPELRALGC